MQHTIPQSTSAAVLGAGWFALFSQDDLNLEALFAFGSAKVATGTGEAIAAVEQASSVPGGASYQSDCAFIAMANRLSHDAEKALAEGPRVTAWSRYLRA